jgi:D-alanyl-D-alanine carboxypeptidase
MPFGRCWIGRRVLFGLAAVLALGAVSARATPYLVVDADSDQVLMQNEATAPWYPASLTKLMTVYVALDAVRNGKLTLDTPLIMSARGARMPPSKMGFRPGTQVTLDNALKMLMVKSPNDVAVMVAAARHA